MPGCDLRPLGEVAKSEGQKANGKGRITGKFCSFRFEVVSVAPLKVGVEPFASLFSAPRGKALRIIAGKYRGRKLKSPPSIQVRPTSDRLRETLFNIIAPVIEGTRFLDLCAGSGAVGIEALSRGASHVTFVDRSRKMCALTEMNLSVCRIPNNETEVVQSEAADFLRQMSRRETWDVVFFDPPYAANYLQVLELFGANAAVLLAEDGMLIVEHRHRNALPEKVGGIVRTRVLRQGDSALSFFKANDLYV
jgi:16S rRNA (guanine(966)-N(2))-methyltransferase RsmD